MQPSLQWPCPDNPPPRAGHSLIYITNFTGKQTVLCPIHSFDIFGSGTALSSSFKKKTFPCINEVSIYISQLSKRYKCKSVLWDLQLSIGKTFGRKQRLGGLTPPAQTEMTQVCIHMLPATWKPRLDKMTTAPWPTAPPLLNLPWFGSPPPRLRKPHVLIPLYTT